MALQRRAASVSGPVLGVAAHDGQLLSFAPTVHEFLTSLRWDEATKRSTGTVMLLAEDGVWKAWVHDRDGRVSAWVSAGTLLDLLVSLEEGLNGESLNWRADKPGKGK